MAGLLDSLGLESGWSWKGNETGQRIAAASPLLAAFGAQMQQRPSQRNPAALMAASAAATKNIQGLEDERTAAAQRATLFGAPPSQAAESFSGSASLPMTEADRLAPTGGLLGQMGLEPSEISAISALYDANPQAAMGLLAQQAFKEEDPWAGYKQVGNRLMTMGEDGRPTVAYEPPKAPRAAPAPHSAVAKIRRDVALGYITPEQGEALIQQEMQGGGGSAPSLVQEFEYARQNGFEGSFMDYQGARNQRENVGLNPIPGVDQDGNPVIMQMTSGGLKMAEMPEGVSPTKGPLKVDVGSGTVLIDPITGAQTGYYPKDSRTPAFDAARGRVEGAAAGDVSAGASKSLQQAEEMLGVIDGVANDPQLGNALGWAGYSAIPDIPGVNTGPRARISQLQGRTFLQAFESLKGGGQITEVEGQKAESAIARLGTTQTEAEFKAALSDLRSIVETARERAARRGGGQGAFEAERQLQGLSDAELMQLLGQ